MRLVNVFQDDREMPCPLKNQRIKFAFFIGCDEFLEIGQELLPLVEIGIRHKFVLSKL